MTGNGGNQDQPFELIKHLGTGGFAQTWLVRVIDPDLVEEWETDQVAIKIPLSKQKETVLRKEVELNGGLYLRLSEVESRNIVRYLGFCVYDGKIVMVMKFVSGGSLRNLMGPPGRSKPINPETTVELMRGVLSGLAVIHHNQIVHRDIKPENILMDNGIPQISDLGIGRMLRPNELASTVVGTIFYMSPEMLYEKSEGSGTYYNTDIWSVGITFYEMLYGSFPFKIRPDMKIGQIAANIIDEKIPLEFPENISVPAGVRTVLTKALQRDPGRRYASADAMLADLERLDQYREVELEQILAEWQSAVMTPEQIAQIEQQIPQLTAQYPDSVRLYLFIGEFYNKCSHYDQAIQAFQTGVGLDPSQAMLYWGLAMASEKRREYQAAVKYLEKALACGLEKSHERYARILLDSLRRKN